jgi:hypothetical protein
MHAPVNTRFLLIAAGILLIVITGVSIWNQGEIRPYDNVTTVSSEYYTDVLLTDNGNDIGGVYVRPGADQGYGRAVPVKVMVEINSSRYRIDSAELCITRQEMGEIYFMGYQEEFPNARSWTGSDGRSGCTRLETPGWWGESNQAFGFMIPLKNETETVHLFLDARISENGPFWRHARIEVPVTFDLKGYSAPVAGTRETGIKTDLPLPTVQTEPVATDIA